jgi:hypothetical protein
MYKYLRIGDRIKISENYHWAKNEIGEITKPPDFITELADGWKQNVRVVKYLNGDLFFYWVKFDNPQLDSDGDGPYQFAEIESNYITRMEDHN